MWYEYINIISIKPAKGHTNTHIVHALQRQKHLYIFFGENEDIFFPREQVFALSEATFALALPLFLRLSFSLNRALSLFRIFLVFIFIMDDPQYGRPHLHNVIDTNTFTPRFFVYAGCRMSLNARNSRNFCQRIPMCMNQLFHTYFPNMPNSSLKLILLFISDKHKQISHELLLSPPPLSCFIFLFAFFAVILSQLEIFFSFAFHFRPSLLFFHFP